MTRIELARLAGVALLTAGFAGAGTAQAAEQYIAELMPLNATTLDRTVSGTARFTVDNGELTITISADGLAPRIMHMQHYHGFPGGDDATCPMPQADTNGDGFIDLIETEPMAGTTMVPLHTDPASLEIASDTYPVADGEGAIRYQQIVSVDELRQALDDKFGVPEPELEKRVVFLHGIPSDADLPESVQSLPGVPAQMTLPVACGVIERLE
jgi:hypothetical protein